MQHPSKRLHLVVEPPESGGGVDQVEPGSGVAQRWEEIVAEQHTARPDVLSLRAMTPGGGIAHTDPVTARRVLEAAEDARIRAAILEDVATAFSESRGMGSARFASSVGQVGRWAKTVREAADDLRTIATRLIDELGE